MGTMFAVGYHVGGTEEEPYGPRAVMVGLFLCIGTMVVEMTLYLIGASRIDAKQHQRTQTAATGMHDLTRLREFYPKEVKPARRQVSQFTRHNLKQF